MRETKLKQSEVGLIPYNWKIAKISDISTIVTGATPSTEVKTYWEGGTIRWMSSGELNNKQIYEVANQITQDGYEHSGTHMIPPLCVLIGLAGQGKTRGTAAINYVELCTNQSIAAILPNQLIFDSKYLYYYIDSQYESLRLLSAGDGGRGGLNKQTLLNVHVPLPASKLEQERIAKALSDMDGLLDSLTKLIDKKRNIKTAAMQQLLTGKKRLKGFSEPWVEKQMWEVTIWDKKFNGVASYMQKESIKYPYVLANAFEELETQEGDVLLLSTGNYIGWTTEEKAGPHLCEGEIVAIPWGGVANVKYAKGKFVTADNRIATSSDIGVLDNKFLYYLMLFRTDEINSYYRGASIKHPSMLDVLTMVLLIPSIKEQVAIVNILSDMDKEISALEQKRAKYESIKKGMMQELLTGRIRFV